MYTIDFRFRPHTKEILQGFASAFEDAIVAGGTTLEDYIAAGQPIEDIVQEMKANQLLKAVIAGRDIETTYQVPSNNEEIKKFCQAYPEMFVGFVGVDPHKGMKALYELDYRVQKENFAGAATDPLHAHLKPDAAQYYPIYAKCCELNVPVIITGGPVKLVSGAVLEDAHPRYIDRVAADFPDLKIVVSHGAWPFVNEMIAVAFRHKNVYLELSEYEGFSLGKEYVEAANTIIGDKLIFASANPAVNYLEAIKSYQELPFKDSIREDIMWKNAARLLGLDIAK